MTNEYSDKAVFGVVSWVDIIKGQFHLAVVQENHPSLMNKGIT